MSSIPPDFEIIIVPRSCIKAVAALFSGPNNVPISRCRGFFLVCCHKKYSPAVRDLNADFTPVDIDFSGHKVEVFA